MQDAEERRLRRINIADLSAGVVADLSAGVVADDSLMADQDFLVTF